MSEKTSSSNVSIDNIYKLDGRVPVAKAIPFGLQHVMAMFVANLAPILLVCQSYLEVMLIRLVEWSLRESCKVQCL